MKTKDMYVSITCKCLLIKQKISSTLQLQHHLSLDEFVLQKIEKKIKEVMKSSKKTLVIEHLKQVVAY